MYGTVALCRVPPDNVDALLALAAAEERIGIDGYLGTDLLVAENHEDTVAMVVRFRDRASYLANAESPDQDARYRDFRALMLEDPVWYDGEWNALSALGR
jgi:quinol monooxygenase YgiN